MNTTPLTASEYDNGIEKTVPYYSQFYNNVLDLVLSTGITSGSWLDTGCGTGALIEKAHSMFPDIQYTLCDPSDEMLMQARQNLSDIPGCEYINKGSQELDYNSTFDIVTAIQSHHYLKRDERRTAVSKCYDALKDNGVLILFENTAPDTEKGKELVLDRWGRYQMMMGKSEEDTAKHLNRYNKSYFPITIDEHKQLLRETGFRTVEIFWLSYMQAGFYAVK